MLAASTFAELCWLIAVDLVPSENATPNNGTLCTRLRWRASCQGVAAKLLTRLYNSSMTNPEPLIASALLTSYPQFPISNFPGALVLGVAP